MEIYINSSFAISPYDSSRNFIGMKDGRFACIEPDYDNILDARQLRRMSRIMKMALTAAKKAIDDNGNINPDAIITATGLGCLEDTGTFLTKISDPDNRMMNPTSFIQSIHNTMAGQISLFLRNTCYNNTFTQTSLSFEHALFDAVMLLNEKPDNSVLLGGIDELTTLKFDLAERLHLAEKRSNGYYGQGEGSAFFTLSGHKSKVIVKEFILPFMGDHSDIGNYIEAKVDTNDAILLSGNPGNLQDPDDETIKQLFEDDRIIDYKQYCGDYPTSSSFAFWMANQLLNGGIGMPDLDSDLSDVIIHHSYPGNSQSLIHLCRS
ncbi:MAG: beta-ketoacyl synthase chain length factor [Bacteroidetes bacterium]|nr:beta-ketoacyl synthase chain length factor [Bacteroidota bacterium]